MPLVDLRDGFAETAEGATASTLTPRDDVIFGFGVDGGVTSVAGTWHCTTAVTVLLPVLLLLLGSLVSGLTLDD